MLYMPSMENATIKDVTVGARLTKFLARRLEEAADRERDPYAPTQSQIITRGIELALQELERKRPGK